MVVPPSRAPSAVSNAPYPTLPSRPYGTSVSWMYVDDSEIGGLIAAPGTRGGRPACTAIVSGVQSGWIGMVGGYSGSTDMSGILPYSADRQC